MKDDNSEERVNLLDPQSNHEAQSASHHSLNGEPEQNGPSTLVSLQVNQHTSSRDAKGQIVLQSVGKLGVSNRSGQSAKTTAPATTVDIRGSKEINPLKSEETKHAQSLIQQPYINASGTSELIGHVNNSIEDETNDNKHTFTYEMVQGQTKPVIVQNAEESSSASSLEEEDVEQQQKDFDQHLIERQVSAASGSRNHKSQYVRTSNEKNKRQFEESNYQAVSPLQQTERLQKIRANVGASNEHKEPNSTGNKVSPI